MYFLLGLGSKLGVKATKLIASLESKNRVCRNAMGWATKQFVGVKWNQTRALLVFVLRHLVFFYLGHVVELILLLERILVHNLEARVCILS